MTAYADLVFAPIDADHALERIAGGNETEVYRSDDGRFVAKLKAELGCGRHEALVHAAEMRAAAEAFADCLGPRSSIPSFYVLTRDAAGRVQILVLQPYLHRARPLSAVDYGALSRDERRRLAVELRAIIRSAEAMFWERGSMPDLYGRSSASSAERHQGRSLAQLPRRVWSFLVERTLLSSHNLLYTGDPERPVALVDYDFVRRGRLYRLVYYLTRIALFWRDRLVIAATLRA